MAAIDEVRDSLRFLGVENVEDDVLTSMVEASAALGMKPGDIGDAWMAHSLNHNNLSLSFENWVAFKTELHRSMANRMNRKRPSVALNTPVANSPAFNPNKPQANSPFVAKTPLAPIPPSLFNQDAAELASPAASDPAAVGTTVFQFSMPSLSADSPSLTLEDKWWGSEQREPPHVDVHFLKKAPRPFRYMLQKPSEIVIALNNHLEWLERDGFPRPVENVTEQDEGAIVGETKETTSTQKPEEVSASNVAPEQTRMIGRLVLTCSSNETNEGNGSGVSLQGSLESSAGAEIPLHVMPSAVSGFSLSQGQVVAVKGTSAQTSKRLFLAENIILPSLPPPYVSTSTHKDKDFVALIAAGPFMPPGQKAGPTTATINWGGLATVIRRFHPSVVILTGPFGNAGLCDSMVKEISDVNGTPTLCVFIPNHADLGADSPPVYPTPTLIETATAVKRDAGTGVSPPDPGMFDINGAMICATSVDVLRHLASSELHLGAGGGGGDRLTRLASSLVYQRSMYPLYPQGPSVPVDWPLWQKLATIPNMPSLLILPSDLNPFIAPFSPVANSGATENGGDSNNKFPLLVNPGRVARRRAAVVRWSAKDAAFTAGRIIRL